MLFINSDLEGAKAPYPSHCSDCRPLQCVPPACPAHCSYPQGCCCLCKHAREAHTLPKVLLVHGCDIRVAHM